MASSRLQTPALPATTSSGCRSTAATMRAEARRNRSRRSVHAHLALLALFLSEDAGAKRKQPSRVKPPPPPPPPLPMGAEQTPAPVCWIIPRRSRGEACAGQENTVCSNNGSGNGGIVHLQPLQPCSLMVRWGKGEVAGVNAWLQADRGWQRPGYFPHSSGPSILVAQEMDIYFL